MTMGDRTSKNAATPARLAVFAGALVISLLAPGALRADPGVTSYVYDALGRLERVDHDTGARAEYSFDAPGNRTQLTAAAVTCPTGTTCPCIDSICSGTNATLMPLANAAGSNRQRSMYCAGDFLAVTTDANWELSCTTGWIDTNCYGTPGCNDVPADTLDYHGCVNAVCEGVNSIVGPILNGDGVLINPDPVQFLPGKAVFCDNNWSIDVRGSNTYIACGSAWADAP